MKVTSTSGSHKRAMTGQEAEYQAEKYAQHVLHGGNAKRWLDSKDFTAAEQSAILHAFLGSGTDIVKATPMNGS